jgi:hypothetical protein
MYAAPQFVNTRLTDDSIIPAIVIDVIPKEREHHEPSEDNKNHHGRRSGLLRRVMHKEKKDKGISGEQDGPRRITKVVYMPRREYVLTTTLKSYGRCMLINSDLLTAITSGSPEVTEGNTLAQNHTRDGLKKNWKQLLGGTDLL